MRVFPLLILLAAASPVSAEIEADHLERFCLPADLAVKEDDLSSPMKAVKFLNDILNRGDTLRIDGKSARFSDGWIGAPDFTVQATHNGMIVMDRAFVMEGGEGCDAWRTDNTSSQGCNWRTVPAPPIDLKAEPSQTAFMVWETLVLKGDLLTLFTVESVGRPSSTKTYNCDDPDALLRYLRRKD